MGPNPQEIADLVTFTKEILNGKLHFLYSERYNSPNHFIIVQNCSWIHVCTVEPICVANLNSKI